MHTSLAILGLGSNLENCNLENDKLNKLDNLKYAYKLLRKHKSIDVIKASSTYYSKAQLPHNAPKSWEQDFFNIAILIQTTLSPEKLLIEIKKIEKQMGRITSPDWSPRIIDIDILLFDNITLSTNSLIIPHKHLLTRPFALLPAYELIPCDLQDYFFPNNINKIKNILKSWINDNNSTPFSTIKINQRIDTPALMQIINATPNSFSNNTPDTIKSIDLAINSGAHIIDIGAEATNPSALTITPQQEWQRLEPILQYVCQKKSHWYNKYQVQISIDTRNAATLEKAIKLGGIDILNDVSGLQNKNLQNIVKDNALPAIFMHSLTVPANKKIILPLNRDPTQYLYQWAERKIQKLNSLGIKSNNLIFDPGIGFGKNSIQNLQLITNFSNFKKLGIKLLLGHSRKSWLNQFLDNNLDNNLYRDELTSIASTLCQAADILRVHNIDQHYQKLKVRWD